MSPLEAGAHAILDISVPVLLIALVVYLAKGWREP